MYLCVIGSLHVVGFETQESAGFTKSCVEASHGGSQHRGLVMELHSLVFHIMGTPHGDDTQINELFALIAKKMSF